MRAFAQFDLENVGRALLPVHGPTSKLCFQELAVGLSFDKKMMDKKMFSHPTAKVVMCEFTAGIGAKN